MSMNFTRFGLAFAAVVAGALGTTPGSGWTGSGSTGADGAFVLLATDSRIANGVFVFDPVRDNLDVNATNIYNFTTITIPGGVTVQIRTNKLRTPGPIVWLASGPVTIEGTLDVGGNNGHDATVSLSVRAPSEPGPGGFPGGAGAKPGDIPQRGFGPGGGVVPAGTGSSGCAAGFATTYIPSNSSGYWGSTSRCVGGSAPYGNGTLQPFIGGSGGSGGYPNTNANMTGPGGGAGGGAIRITSDVSITVSRVVRTLPNCCFGSASIISNGGNAGAYTGGGNSPQGVIGGGAGSGGSIYLQAPAVTLGYDTLDLITANGGYAGNPCCTNTFEYASAGRIRIDTNNLQTNAIISPTPVVGPLVNAPSPTGQPSVTVVSINGTPVPAQPTGGYTVPDVSINNMGNIPIVISTSNIPNTTINLYVSTEPGTADFVTPVTLTNGTGSANITLPQGVSRFVVRATW